MNIVNKALKYIENNRPNTIQESLCNNRCLKQLTTPKCTSGVCKDFINAKIEQKSKILRDKIEKEYENFDLFD